MLLFAPPFDTSPEDPGYIKGYLPGLRENGGQYTHAAIWVLMAQAMLRDGERVGELLKILNPVRHSTSPDAARLYRVEPYVVAADIYAGQTLASRGGWTWVHGRCRLVLSSSAGTGAGGADRRGYAQHQSVHSARSGRSSRWS